jgi:hypothetical protein
MSSSEKPALSMRKTAPEAHEALGAKTARQKVICEICGRRVNVPSMGMHMKTHRDERPQQSLSWVERRLREIKGDK